MIYIFFMMLGAILGAFAMCLCKSQPAETHYVIWDGNHAMGCSEDCFRALVDGVKK